jgi:hypothetical protein
MRACMCFKNFNYISSVGSIASIMRVIAISTADELIVTHEQFCFF